LIKSLKNFFSANSLDTKDENNEDLNILCGLMIEAANTDGKITDEEVNKISSTLTNIFNENPVDVEKILKESIATKDEPKSLFFFTSKINKSFTEKKKLLLIEILWEIILSDGELHEFESNLIRRLAGLLYISDVSCGNAKNKAIEKINNNN
tara:strand:+ start:731 stop:1186 length:456 start_codon:yes stop_codon:yes gene_type:complete